MEAEKRENFESDCSKERFLLKLEDFVSISSFECFLFSNIQVTWAGFRSVFFDDFGRSAISVFTVLLAISGGTKRNKIRSNLFLNASY